MAKLPPQQLYEKAIQLEKENQLGTANSLLEKAMQAIDSITDERLIFNIYYHYATNLGGLEKYEEAITYYEKATETCPSDNLRWLAPYGIGFALSNLNRLSEVIEPYTTALKYCEEVEPRYYAFIEIADAYFELGDIEKTIEYYEKAFAIARDNKMFSEMMNAIHDLSNLYMEFDYNEEGRDLLEFGLQTAKEEKENDWERLFLGNLSTAYLGTRQLEKAKDFAQQLLQIGEQTREIDDKTTALNNLAMYHRARGEYALGIDYMHQAIELEDNPISKAIEYRNISTFYEEVGDWNLASFFMHQALDIVEEEKHWEKIIKYRFHAGDLYFSKENYPLAIQYYEACIEAFANYPESEEIVEVLTHIGSSWSRLDEFEKGLDYIEKALEKAKKVKTSDRILSIVYNALAGMYLREDYFEEAEKYYQISQELDDDSQDFTLIFNIAAYHHMVGNYSKAEELILKAIELFENQRRTLSTFDRKFYDDKNGQLYEYLVAIKARQKEPLTALKAIEKLKSRALLEELNFDDTSININQIIKDIETDEAIIYYVNSMHNNPLILCITSEKINATFLPIENLEALTEPIKGKINSYFHRFNDGNTLGNIYAKASIPHPGWFDSVILYYRNRLLQHPDFWKSKEKQTKWLAHQLYKYLIEPIAENLKDKKRVTIIPDRSLYLIPFETLVDEKERYLVELYSFNYLPNLSLKRILSDRNYHFEKNGLALGISKYEPLSDITTNTLEKLEEIPALRMELKKSISIGENLDIFYAKIGIQAWPNLPDVANELKYFKNIIPQSEYAIGSQVNPEWLIQQSKSGQLTKYRVLHFANHGIAVPAIPELSAIVMHPEKNGNRYVNTEQIKELDITADMVFLSACETGLGEVIPSIGVIGLPQSFLMAGTKSVQSSLWEIHDEQSSKIISCFYQELVNNNWDYAEALAVTKRKCIKGELGEGLQNPLYWASVIRFGHA